MVWKTDFDSVFQTYFFVEYWHLQDFQNQDKFLITNGSK